MFRGFGLGSHKHAASAVAPLDVAGVRRKKIGSQTSAMRGILVASLVMVSHLIHVGSGQQQRLVLLFVEKLGHDVRG